MTIFICRITGFLKEHTYLFRFINTIISNRYDPLMVTQP
jgi:hypothetical protein